jgi:hypothetical protein
MIPIFIGGNLSNIDRVMTGERPLLGIVANGIKVRRGGKCGYVAISTKSLLNRLLVRATGRTASGSVGDMATDGEGQTTIERLGSVLGRLLAVPALLVLFIAGLYAVGDAVLSSAPSPRNPGFVDSVLASGAVLAAVRLAIIAAAGYVVSSVVALVARRQWLTRVGPVEVSARVSDLEAENTVLRDALDSAEARVEDLDEGLAKTRGALDTALGNIGQEWEHK